MCVMYHMWYICTYILQVAYTDDGEKSGASVRGGRQFQEEEDNDEDEDEETVVTSQKGNYVFTFR